MATEQHKSSALDGFKLDFEQTGTERQLSAFTLRKMQKEKKHADRGPSLFRQIFEVYGEVIFA